MSCSEEPPIELNGQTEVIAKSGRRLQYQFRKHESVGFNASYTIAEPEILSFDKEEVSYLNPENNQADTSGGDDATGTFFFRAKRPGETVITVKHLFRGTVEQDVSIKVFVR